MALAIMVLEIENRTETYPLSRVADHMFDGAVPVKVAKTAVHSRILDCQILDRADSDGIERCGDI